MIWRAIQQNPTRCLISKWQSLNSAPHTSNVRKADKQVPQNAQSPLYPHIQAHLTVRAENTSIQSDS